MALFLLSDDSILKKKGLNGEIMSREELAVLLDARDKLCGFCENDACEKCQVTLLIDDAFAECDELDD